MAFRPDFFLKGRANRAGTPVPSLQDICVRYLQQHVSAIDSFGDLPDHFVQAVFAHAGVDQLQRLEDNNPERCGDLDILWKRHFLALPMLPREAASLEPPWRSKYFEHSKWLKEKRAYTASLSRMAAMPEVAQSKTVRVFKPPPSSRARARAKPTNPLARIQSEVRRTLTASSSVPRPSVHGPARRASVPSGQSSPAAGRKRPASAAGLEQPRPKLAASPVARSGAAMAARRPPSTSPVGRPANPPAAAKKRAAPAPGPAAGASAKDRAPARASASTPANPARAPVKIGASTAAQKRVQSASARPRPSPAAIATGEAKRPAAKPRALGLTVGLFDKPRAAPGKRSKP